MSGIINLCIINIINAAIVALLFRKAIKATVVLFFFLGISSLIFFINPRYYRVFKKYFNFLYLWFLSLVERREILLRELLSARFFYV